MKIYHLIFTLAFLCNCSSNDTNSNYPMATPEDPPNGTETQPGENTVMLGRYKTCDGYAELLRSKLSTGMKAVATFFSPLQDFSTEKCNNSYTCHCANNQYFIDDLRGQLEVPLYRCIEPPSANVESNETYAPNQSFSGEGVIKIALPRSACTNVQ